MYAVTAGVVAAILVSGSVSFAHADVLPLSGVFGVAAGDNPRNVRTSPDVVATGDGGFIIAWSGSDEHPIPGKYAFERRFDAQGVRLQQGTPRLSSSFAAASIRLLQLPSNRHLVVVTDGSGRDLTRDGLFGSIFEDDGDRIGKEFPVNLAHRDGMQRDPGLAHSGNSILVAWSDDANELRLQILSQRFKLDGERVGAEQVLASYPDEEAYHASAAGLGGVKSGDVVVAWESLPRTYPGTGYDIAARIVRSDGSLSDRIVLNESLVADEIDPRLQPTPDGFVVSWTSYSSAGVDVYVRRFDRDAKPLTGDILVNTYRPTDQDNSNLAVSASGAFVVVWRSWVSQGDERSQDGNATGLFAQAFFADGTRNGSEFQVSTEWIGFQGFSPERAGIAFVNDTDFVITWDKRYFDPIAVEARRFRLTTDRRLCGDVVGADLTIRMSDALAILRSATGSATCDLCSCDIDGSGDVTAGDSTAVLRIAVGIRTEAVCPRCE